MSGLHPTPEVSQDNRAKNTSSSKQDDGLFLSNNNNNPVSKVGVGISSKNCYLDFLGFFFTPTLKMKIVCLEPL